MSDDELRFSEPRVNDLGKQLISPGADRTKFDASHAALQDSFPAARSETENLQRRIASLEHDLEHSQALLSRSKSEKQCLEDRMETLSARVEVAEEIRDKTQAELEKLDGRLARVTDELTVAEQELHSSERARKDCQKANAAMNDQLLELRSEIAHHRSKTGNSSSRDRDKVFEADTAMVEAALLEANREIGRLKALLRQQPVGGKQIGQVEQNMGARQVEQNNSIQANDNISVNYAPTSFYDGPSSVHMANLSMKQPRTPGRSLNDVSASPDTFSIRSNLTPSYLG